MQYFKQIFYKLLEYLKITGSDADDMANEFVAQVNARFVEEYLAAKLPKEQLEEKVEVYKKLIAENKINELQADLKTYFQNPNEIGEAYAHSYINHMAAFIQEMTKEGEIKPEQLKEIENLMTHTVKNANLQYKVEVSKNEGKIENVLKSIAN